jgi:hypothetical protein
MTEQDWDDERLAAAFRAQFDRPAPAGLEKDVHVHIVGTAPARFGAMRHRGPGWSLAAAAVIVIVIGTVAFSVGGLGRGVGTPNPSDAGAHASPAAIPTPTEQALPGVVFGLPIIHLADAFAIRNAGIDDREIAVQGWFEGGLMPGCPAPNVNPINPLQVGCPDGFVWLMERAETLISHSGNRTDMTGPSGPALNPDLDGIERSWQPTAAEALDANGLSIPTDVVFVGHFDDRRAALCPKAEVADCRDRFVVDSVARVHGVEPPLSVMGAAPGSTKSTVADIEAIIANEAPQSTILSMLVVDPETDVTTIEPSLASTGDGSLVRTTVWVVRVLETDRIATYIVVDGSDTIYEMNADNHAIQVGGTPPGATPAPSIGQWPPADARVVALTSPVGAGKPAVQVAIVDESGRLASVAETGAVDPRTLSFDGRLGAYAEPGDPGRVHLAWVGGMCDSQITVTVAVDVRSITFDMGPQPDCDSIGVGRQLVLDFTGSVDAAAIELLDAADPAPTASAPAYQVDCGSLGPDTCTIQAGDIVASSQAGDPPKRVVSISFSLDPCGSYRVTFDDGTSTHAIIDCVIAPGPS